MAHARVPPRIRSPASGNNLRGIPPWMSKFDPAPRRRKSGKRLPRSGIISGVRLPVRTRPSECAASCRPNASTPPGRAIALLAAWAPSHSA